MKVKNYLYIFLKYKLYRFQALMPLVLLIYAITINKSLFYYIFNIFLISKYIFNIFNVIATNYNIKSQLMMLY